jgi:hypothetical protein
MKMRRRDNMSKIKIEKDNVILSIDEEELAQYKARGYDKVGATKKVASKDLEKEISKLNKTNEELNKKIIAVENEKSELLKSNEELNKKIAELEKKIK